MPRQPKFVRAGWKLLHHAALDFGAEVDYDPEDYPELHGDGYLDPSLYEGLIGPLIAKARIDFDALGSRSDSVEQAILEWLSTGAYEEAPDVWNKLLGMRTRPDLYLAFIETKPKRRFPGCPDHPASDLISILRCGYWLITEGSKRKKHSTESVLWGLALIGAYWQRKSKAGYCKYCFRRARPGSSLCAFHWQGDMDPHARVQSVMRYRLARRVSELRRHEKCVDLISRLNDYMGDSMAKTTMLSSILYPCWPAEGWDNELRDLKFILRRSPRTVKLLNEPRLYKMTYEQLAELLRQRIDPFEFDNFVWDAKVMQAEIWFEFEARFQKGVRGPGHKTSLRVLEAIELAKLGATGGEIAKHFQVSPATVSRWKTRYPNLAKALTKS